MSVNMLGLIFIRLWQPWIKQIFGRSRFGVLEGFWALPIFREPKEAYVVSGPVVDGSIQWASLGFVSELALSTGWAHGPSSDIFYYFLESWNSGLSLFTPLIFSFLLNWLLLILMGTPAPTLPPYYPSSLLCSASFVFLPRLDLMVQFAQVPHRCLHIFHPVGLSPFPHVAATSGYFSLNPVSCHSQVPRTDRGSWESVLKGCR